MYMCKSARSAYPSSYGDIDLTKTLYWGYLRTLSNRLHDAHVAILRARFSALCLYEITVHGDKTFLKKERVFCLALQS